MSKERVDTLVVQLGLAASRERAKRLIMAGMILDEKGQRYDKPGEKIPADTKLRSRGDDLPYVSRAGLKLKQAIDTFGINLKGANVLDIGASTGGFTDAALQAGADHVYALDVGTNQLAWSLRQDERVTVMEQTNFRYSQPEDFIKGTVTFASIDVSFISLELILPALYPILQDEGGVVALVKPQFEAGKDKIGKHGLVSDPKVHCEVLHRIITVAESLLFSVLGLTYSPIKGGKEGNIEFLLYLHKGLDSTLPTDIVDVEDIVNRAHQTLTR